MDKDKQQQDLNAAVMRAPAAGNVVEEVVVTGIKLPENKPEPDYSKIDFTDKKFEPRTPDYSKHWITDTNENPDQRYAVALRPEDFKDVKSAAIALARSVVRNNTKGAEYDPKVNHNMDAAPAYSGIKPSSKKYGVTLKIPF